MRFIIQVVTNSDVKIDGEIRGAIDRGYMVLIGVGKDDTKEIADKMIKKMLGLRIMADENGKTNLSLKDVNGELLLISQFTLYADCTHGNRPGFTKAGKPDYANEMYEKFGEKLRENDVVVKTGVFGADMKVDIQNLGPVTIMLDSKELLKK